MDAHGKTSNSRKTIGTAVGLISLLCVVSGVISGGWAVVLILFALLQFLEAYWVS